MCVFISFHLLQCGPELDSVWHHLYVEAIASRLEVIGSRLEAIAALRFL